MYIWKKILAQQTKKPLDLFGNNGSSNILLLELQLEEVLKLLIYLVNLYNSLVSSQYFRKTIKQLIESKTLLLLPVILWRRLNLHYINLNTKTLNLVKQVKNFFK